MKTDDNYYELKKYVTTELGLQFASKHFKINVEAAKQIIKNLGPSGTRHDARTFLGNALFESNIKWYGLDVLDKVPVVKQYTDLS